MATIVKKEYRKPYILTEGGYQEMMRSTSDKSVWNDIFEVDPVWAEFLFTRAELPDAATAAEIRYLRYIKQSEFKKMYSGRDYVEEEYLWTGPPGITDDGDFDFPWRPIEGGGVWGGGGTGPPFTVACDSESDGCYCPGQQKDVIITGTLPIVGIQFIFPQGETVAGYKNLGTNEVTVTIDTPATRTGQMRIRVFEKIGDTTCDPEINIYQCPDDECCGSCDSFYYDWDNSDETIGAPDSATVTVAGGTPPYTWSIVSEDGKWHLASTVTQGASNLVTTDAGACGKGVITVTDSCDCEVTGSIRNPASGSWSLIDATCSLSGAPTTAWFQSAPSTFQAQKIQGGYRQDETMQAGAGTVCAVGEANCVNSPAATCSARTECITHPDPWVNSFNPCASCVAGGTSAPKVASGWWSTGCVDCGFGWCQCVVCQLATSTKAYYEWVC